MSGLSSPVWYYYVALIYGLVKMLCVLNVVEDTINDEKLAALKFGKFAKNLFGRRKFGKFIELQACMDICATGE